MIYRYISIKGATSAALDHIRNVHGVEIKKKMKKKEAVVALGCLVSPPFSMNMREAHLLLTMDMVLSKASFNSANSVTQAVIAKQLCGDATASFNDKRAKVSKQQRSSFFNNYIW
jgi:hypothetical protein